MIGRKDEKNRAGIAPGSMEGGDGNGRSGLALDGFKDDIGLNADLHQLLRDNETNVVAGDDDGRLKNVRGYDALKRSLKCGMVIQQVNELLRHAIPGSRPEPRP